MIKLHLDSYIQEVLNEYTEYIKKSLRPKRVPMSPGLVLNNEDCPVVPDPSKQKYYRSFLTKLQFVALSETHTDSVAKALTIGLAVIYF